MKRKCSGKGLGLYQSKNKKRRNKSSTTELEFSNEVQNHNDSISTIGYELHKEDDDLSTIDFSMKSQGEEEQNDLHEILDRISVISKESMESIESEYLSEEVTYLSSLPGFNGNNENSCSDVEELETA